MSTGTFLLLLAFAAALLGSPGPATLSLAASGAAYGWRRCLPFLSGLITGLVFNLLAAVVGLVALFSHYPLARAGFKYTSGAYILYLAWKIAKSDPVKTKAAQRAPGFIQGVIFNVLNPKAYIAALSIFAQFTTPRGNPRSEGIVIFFSCMAVAAVFGFSWLYSGAFLGHIFSTPSSAKRLNLSLALIMVLCVLYTVLSIG